jgi:hypothetical protein
MRPGGAKAKGNLFESQVAKKLGIWYYNDENALARVPTSGAMGTVRGEDFVEQGDIRQVAHHERPFPFSVECKHHAEIQIAPFLLGNEKCKLARFWQQCMRDAIKQDLIPLLVFKQNRGTAYVCVVAPLIMEPAPSEYMLGRQHLITTLEEFCNEGIEQVR